MPEIKKCPKCKWMWEPRVLDPRRCPRCGVWLIEKPVTAKN